MSAQTQFTNQITVKPLSLLEVGQAGWIVSLETKSVENERELTSLGISPQAIVRMFARHKSHFIFKVDDKKFVADREVAAGIMVRPLV